MIDVSLVAARHSAQLRSQRKKVFVGVQGVLRDKDPRVLGVFNQMQSDEQYETKVSSTIRNGLDVITSIFEKVQEAEAKIKDLAEREDFDAEYQIKSDREMAVLQSEYESLRNELEDTRKEKALASSLAAL